MVIKKRTYPIGAEILPEGTHFRVWAPDHHKVELVIEKLDKQLAFPLKKEKKGYFSLITQKAPEGTLYYYRLSNGQMCSDPASRYQPQGPFGPSCVVDPKFAWTDRKWKGVTPYNQINYELHIGTFTLEGTFESATAKLKDLSELGITLIEMMPIAEFPGHFGWGYEGVNLFAPFHVYGTPKDLKAFVNQAHELGMGVILDVVYNHLGPEGSQLLPFSQEYLSKQHKTDWGKAVNFDSPSSREYFLTNAQYWIKEFHFDGLRIDATPLFFSSTETHILKELTQVTKKAGEKRKILIIGENEPQNTQLIREYKDGGYGFDMLWNDDFHHTSHVALTGKREAYFFDFLGTPQEFISSIKYGFLYQGQYYAWQKKNRGTYLENIPPQAMMIFLENHDQIANSGYGLRLHKRSDPGNYKALVTLLILSPNTPLIFQGQEFNSSKPFCYFADHPPALSSLIKEGRKRELSQFPRLKTEEVQQDLPHPENPLTFIQCKLDHHEKKENEAIYSLFKDLIRLRRTDPVFSQSQKIKIDGAVLGTEAFLIRYFHKQYGDRLVIINFGADFYFNPSPEPLLVPGVDMKFEILLSSEAVGYGGGGIPPINIPYWKILGHSAIVLKSVSTRSKTK